MTHGAFAFDQSTVLLHEGLRKRQPEAATALTTRDEWQEDPIADFLWHARAIVNHMQV